MITNDRLNMLLPSIMSLKIESNKWRCLPHFKILPCGICDAEIDFEMSQYSYNYKKTMEILISPKKCCFDNCTMCACSCHLR